MKISADKEHKISRDGTYYRIDTPDELISIIERARIFQERLRFHWGDTDTGKDWEEAGMVGTCGTIGRSTGKIKVPLLIHNIRSLGGGEIPSNCIVKITYSNKAIGGTLYEHPKYHTTWQD